MKKLLLLTIFVLSVQLTVGQDLQSKDLGASIENFSALDDEGNVWNLKNIKSDFVVVYFYPAAMTGGCTKQACAYRDNKAVFDGLSATIIGVSGDEHKNLKYFKDSYELNFTLLSDNEGKISEAFGVPVRNGGSIEREIEGQLLNLTRGVTTPRWTFVLDKDRKIIYKNAQVNAVQDSEQVLEILKRKSD